MGHVSPPPLPASCQSFLYPPGLLLLHNDLLVGETSVSLLVDLCKEAQRHLKLLSCQYRYVLALDPTTAVFVF